MPSWSAFNERLSYFKILSGTGAVKENDSISTQFHLIFKIPNVVIVCDEHRENHWDVRFRREQESKWEKTVKCNSIGRLRRESVLPSGYPSNPHLWLRFILFLSTDWVITSFLPFVFPVINYYLNSFLNWWDHFKIRGYIFIISKDKYFPMFHTPLKWPWKFWQDIWVSGTHKSMQISHWNLELVNLLLLATPYCTHR